MNNSATTRTITKIALEYNGNDKGTAEMVSSNNLLSSTSEGQFHEMKTVADRNPKVKKWALTGYISQPDEIGRKLMDKEFAEIATKALDKVGVTANNQFRLDIHNSTKQKHIHFVVNRINISGKCTVKSHDIEQENYYIGESNNGYIKLKRGQDYLFDDPNWTTKTIFAADSQTESSFSYDNNDNIVKFSVPNLGKQKDYTFALIAKNKNGGQTSGGNTTQVTQTTTGNNEDDSSVTTETETKVAQNLSKDGEIDRLSFVFRTSKYNKMSDKLSALNFNTLWMKGNSSDVVILQNNMNADEYFDVAELTGTKYTDNKPLINLTALMDDSFAGKFKGLFYDAYPVDQLILDRSENEEDFAGIPPVKAFPVFTSYLQYLGSDKGNSFLKQTFPYKYDLFSFYKSDWYELVSKAASKYIGTPANARPQVINNLLQSTYGIIPTIRYKVKAKYVLPGDKAGSEKQIEYEYK